MSLLLQGTIKMYKQVRIPEGSFLRKKTMGSKAGVEKERASTLGADDSTFVGFLAGFLAGAVSWGETQGHVG